jgi:tetratricopeptide (TPR) repeat protein
MAEVKLEDAPQGVRTYYDKGVAAMERDNLEYAMDMFTAALNLEPRLLQVRKLLRSAAIKKAKVKPTGKMAVAMGMGRLVKASSLLKKNPLQALEISEKLLRIDPFNLKFTKTQCEAAKAAELPEIAIQTLEILKDRIPENLAVLKPLAELYLDEECYELEYECRTAIAKLKPNDATALKELKDSAARLTMGKTGWQKAESYRDVMRDVSPEHDAGNEIEKLKQKIKQEPDNLTHYKALADLQLGNKLYDDAIETLKLSLQLSSSPDAQIEQKLIKAQEHRIGFELAKAEDADDRDRLSGLRKKLKDIRIENAARQVERYPNDLQLKFDYGKLLIEQERQTEAIQQFQLSQKNPQRRIRSLIYLAQAFREKGQLGIAKEQLESALAELPIMDESKKEVLYELGILCEMTNEQEQAAQYLKEIYAVDIGYRDVANRVEST